MFKKIFLSVLICALMLGITPINIKAEDVAINTIDKADKVEEEISKWNLERLQDDIKSAGFIYGIGGFHRYDPVGLKLNSPAKLTIPYDDEELAFPYRSGEETIIDESQLAIFYWDRKVLKWALLGGTVDAGANKVSVEIMSLGTYTIGVKSLLPELSFLAIEEIPTSTSKTGV